MEPSVAGGPNVIKPFYLANFADPCLESISQSNVKSSNQDTVKKQ